MTFLFFLGLFKTSVCCSSLNDSPEKAEEHLHKNTEVLPSLPRLLGASVPEKSCQYRIKQTDHVNKPSFIIYLRFNFSGVQFILNIPPVALVESPVDDGSGNVQHHPSVRPVFNSSPRPAQVSGIDGWSLPALKTPSSQLRLALAAGQRRAVK